jgi:hypothetical protein
MEDQRTPLEHLWEEKIANAEGFFVNCCPRADALL